MSVDILGTNCDQCRSRVQCCFTSTETVRLIRTESPGRPPRLPHSSRTLRDISPLHKDQDVGLSSPAQTPRNIEISVIHRWTPVLAVLLWDLGRKRIHPTELLWCSKRGDRLRSSYKKLCVELPIVSSLRIRRIQDSMERNIDIIIWTRFTT